MVEGNHWTTLRYGHQKEKSFRWEFESFEFYSFTTGMEESYILGKQMTENEAMVLITERQRMKCSCSRYCKTCKFPETSNVPPASQSKRTIEKRKASLDQGRKKSKPKKKEKKKASSSSSQLINTQELSSDADSKSFVE